MVNEKYFKILDLSEKIVKCDKLIHNCRNNDNLKDLQKILVDTRNVITDEIDVLYNSKDVDDTKESVVKSNKSLSSRRNNKTSKK